MISTCQSSKGSNILEHRFEKDGNPSQNISIPIRTRKPKKTPEEKYSEFKTIAQSLLGLEDLNNEKLWAIFSRSRMNVDRAVKKMKKKLKFYRIALICNQEIPTS